MFTSYLESLQRHFLYFLVLLKASCIPGYHNHYHQNCNSLSPDCLVPNEKDWGCGLKRVDKMTSLKLTDFCFSLIKIDHLKLYMKSKNV